MERTERSYHAGKRNKRRKRIDGGRRRSAGTGRGEPQHKTADCGTAKADTLAEANHTLKEAGKEETKAAEKTGYKKTEEEKDKKNPEEDVTKTEEAKQTYEHVDVRL